MTPTDAPETTQARTVLITGGAGFLASALSLPPKSRSVPYPVAYGLGAVMEFAAKLMRPVKAFYPTLTRSSVRIVCQDFCFDGEKATRELGYKPVYSEAESLDRTVAFFREHRPVPSPEIPETR